LTINKKRLDIPVADDMDGMAPKHALPKKRKKADTRWIRT
jgi:hypothetical protein